MSDFPQSASVLLIGPAPWREDLLSTLAQCPQVAVKQVENASDTVQALLSHGWTVVAFLLEGDTTATLEMAASLDGISRGRQATGNPTLRLGLRPGGFPNTATVPAGLDRLEACPATADGWLEWLNPQTEIADAGPAFDAENLIDRMMGNEMLAKRVVSVFLADAPRQLLALSEALEKEDAASGSRIAHSLRGSASNAGGDALIELARGIESGCKAGELTEAKRILPELSNQFSRLKPKLEAFVG